MSKTLRFDALLQNDHWIKPAYVELNDTGIIRSISNGDPQNSKSIEIVRGYAIPGFQNAHSHAFQYAMAGLAETHSHKADRDDFWSWRKMMYGIASTIAPDTLEAIATMLYSEMLRNGYTSVAEFHYLHHNKDGTNYANIAEMGERLISAAEQSGIKITLIPIFYQKGGFGKEPEEQQKRFISKEGSSYLKLLEKSVELCNKSPIASCGAGIHSLRAVEGNEVIDLCNQNKFNGPFHIHVSEQLKEIEQSLNYLNKRPVEWLLENIQLSERFNLVHATHINDKEIKGIADNKANVVLCPSTEGNLGDGLFPLKKFQDLGGNWSIGTDSHIGINPFEELRLLDYGQRLTTHKRNIFNDTTENDSGQFAIRKSLITGRLAMGNLEKQYFNADQPFDALIINSESPLLSGRPLENVLSTIIYSGDTSYILGTIVNGKWIVQDQRHKNQSEITTNFTSAIKKLDLK